MDVNYTLGTPSTEVTAMNKTVSAAVGLAM
jgi:hypothetical protein